MSDRAENVSLAAGSRPPGQGRARPDPAAIAAVLLSGACIIVLFWPWNALCLRLGGHLVCGTGIGVLSGWAGFGVVAGVGAICLVLWEGLAAAGALVLPGPAAERRVAAALGAALALFALLRVLTHLRGLTAFGWLGLALAVAACALTLARLRADARAVAGPPPAGR